MNYRALGYVIANESRDIILKNIRFWENWNYKDYDFKENSRYMFILGVAIKIAIDKFSFLSHRNINMKGIQIYLKSFVKLNH